MSVVVSDASPHLSGLDKGESEAIILAGSLSASLIILDDRDARRYAQTNQLAIIGTVGILLLAKSNGLLSAIKQPLDALVAAGVRIDPLLYSNALLRAGE
jgi:predicted nucleic acid-binding protein